LPWRTKARLRMGDGQEDEAPATVVGHRGSGTANGSVPYVARYAAWNAAISAAADWRETAAAGAGGASYGFQVSPVMSA
jgi:hypothetical protein